MREIKFKFLLENGEVTEPYYLKELIDSDAYINIECEYSSKIKQELQYTGLKDKNNVEIYEGDILTTLYITPMGNITDILSNEIYLVEFKNGMFGYSSKTKFNPLEDFIIKTKGEYISNCGCKTIYNETIIEVIGNIYENPELLN